jgi:hypothetical protein
MSMDRPINLSGGGPPETILSSEPAEADDLLGLAVQLQVDDRRSAVAAVVTRWPRHLGAWVMLGDLGRDTIESYASYRVAYHRGLDTLRQSGWRGSGFVRWEHPTNRGFLSAVAGLARTAGVIGEIDEEQRCELFLRQLDPAWPPVNAPSGETG